ncbi:uncharacterized protein LOC131875160 [Cryptomeria japonica]|uniref:uncharacterized protein LOC131875160 n=1 Tax=Cryptomeria japonica TaxID=3369 RepID=UPI0027DA6B41|nr:uncharacterized protein LOC131875160 [Cryptomeria japonica]
MSSLQLESLGMLGNCHFAPEKVFECVLEILIALHPKLLQQVDNLARTPLHNVTCLHGISDITKILLEKDSSLCYKVDNNHQTTLHIAVKERNLDLVTKILNYTKDCIQIVDNDNDGRTALHLAIENAVQIFDRILRWIKTLVMLVTSKRLINKPDKLGKSALDIAMDKMGNDERLFYGDADWSEVARHGTLDVFVASAGFANGVALTKIKRHSHDDEDNLSTYYFIEDYEPMDLDVEVQDKKRLVELKQKRPLTRAEENGHRSKRFQVSQREKRDIQILCHEAKARGVNESVNAYFNGGEDVLSRPKCFEVHQSDWMDVDDSVNVDKPFNNSIKVKLVSGGRGIRNGSEGHYTSEYLQENL